MREKGEKCHLRNKPGKWGKQVGGEGWGEIGRKWGKVESYRLLRLLAYLVLCSLHVKSCDHGSNVLYSQRDSNFHIHEPNLYVRLYFSVLKSGPHS